MKFSSTAVGGVENRVRVIHMGGSLKQWCFLIYTRARKYLGCRTGIWFRNVTLAIGLETFKV